MKIILITALLLIASLFMVSSVDVGDTSLECEEGETLEVIDGVWECTLDILTSTDLDNVCSLDNSFMFKYNDSWGCGVIDSNTSNITITVIDNTTHLYLIDETDPFYFSNPNGYISSYTDTNCAVDGSCPNITYDSEAESTYIPYENATKNTNLTPHNLTVPQIEVTVIIITDNGTAEETQYYRMSKRPERTTDGYYLQGQTSGNDSLFEFFTKDGDRTDNIFKDIYGFGSIDNDNHYERLRSGWNAISKMFEITTQYGGTGKPSNISIYTQGNPEQLLLKTDGDIKMNNSLEAENITLEGSLIQEGYRIAPCQTGGALTGNATCLWFNSTEYGEVPVHIFIQGGTPNQMSVIASGLAITGRIDDNLASIDGRTRCSDIFGNALVSQKIDCEGGDLIVQSDQQVVNNSWARDSNPNDQAREHHNIPDVLTEIDNLFNELYFGETINILTNGIFIINTTENRNIRMNINSTNYEANKSYPVNLTYGTNETPVRNYITWQVINKEPVLVSNQTYPSDTFHIDVAIVIRGEGNDFLYVPLEHTNTKAIYKSLERAVTDYKKYIDGLDPSAGTADFNLTSGEYWVSLTEFDSTNDLSTTDGFYIVLNNGTFVQCEDFSCFTEYNDGNLIEGNAYFNVVWAVVPNGLNTSRLVAIVQDKPKTTYVIPTTAINDIERRITHTINDEEINRHKLVLARTIIKNTDDLQQMFESGDYYQKIYETR